MRFFGKQIFGGREGKSFFSSRLDFVGSGFSHHNEYARFAAEGYQQNVIAHRCINLIAKSASTIPFKIMQGRGDAATEVENHDLEQVMRRPNKLQSHAEFMEAVHAYLLLSGNCYILRTDVESISGRRAPSLKLLRPDRVRVKIHKPTGMPEAYEYKAEGRTETFEADPISGESLVKHIKLFNPLSDEYGMSPLIAAQLDIAQHAGIINHNLAILKNDGRPSGILKISGVDSDGNKANATDAQLDEADARFSKKFDGEMRAGKPIIVGGDVDFKPMGLTAKEMDYIKQRNTSARDIATAYGVPAQLVGLPDSQTYSNYAEARLALVQDTVIPQARRVEGDINEWLGPVFSNTEGREPVRFVYDYDSIGALEYHRNSMIDSFVKAVEAGIMTTNEARERLTLEADDDGNILRVRDFPLASIVDGSATSEEDPNAEGDE